MKKFKLISLIIILMFVILPINAEEPESNSIQKDKIATRRVAPCSFIITSKTTYKGNPVRVSPYLEGPGDIGMIYSTTITDSFNISGSISFTAGMKVAFISEVEAKFGGGWTHQTSTNTSISITKYVPDGKTGVIEFTPFYTKYSGIYYDENLVAHEVSGMTPNKINGFADGIFSLVYY